MTDEEAIFAYIDGELEGAERTRIEAAIRSDPALREMVAEHRALAAQLKGAFSTVLEAPVPPALSAAAAAGADVISMANERSRRVHRRPVWETIHWAAMAATLVAGLIGGVLFSANDSGPVTEHGGQLIASGRLGNALNTQLASAQTGTEPVRIGLTFRNHGGDICRTFDTEHAEGLACRAGAIWQLQGLFGREKASNGAYRMAASSSTAILVDGLIVGEALDQAQERVARAKGWPPSKRP